MIALIVTKTRVFTFSLLDKQKMATSWIVVAAAAVAFLIALVRRSGGALYEANALSYIDMYLWRYVVVVRVHKAHSAGL